jgi:hypothetical protein
MRLSRLILIPAALVLLMSGPAGAQEWGEFYSAIDLFKINVPGKPTVEEIKYASYYGNLYPARVYRIDEGANRYSITAVDYTDAVRINQERRKACKDGAPCTQGPEYDVLSAMDHATWEIMKRAAKVTFFGWGVQDRISGRQLRFANADGTKGVVSIHMHENRLYIVEATLPARAGEPGLLHHSLQFIDSKGHLARYKTVYTNGYPAPPREEQEDNADFVKRTNADFLKARQAK